MVAIATLLTTPHRTADAARRALGQSLLAAAALVAAAGLLIAQGGYWRLIAASAGTVTLLFGLVKLMTAADLRRLARAESLLLGSLVGQLPAAYYILADLEIVPSWLEPVHVWAVVVGPGGLAIVQPCAEEGDLVPCGHVWMVGRGGRRRAIPSPAAAAWTSAEALREVIGTTEISVVPVVTLTNIDAVYHAGDAGAEVVGGPHLAAGLARRLGGTKVIWNSLQLAAYLAQLHR